MLSPELEHILQLLYREARNARYEFISLEHLLLLQKKYLLKFEFDHMTYIDF